ncbi:hypothetical protein [Thalassomonas sp. M1454]|uniref:hypothetical protein n=1 Tax=Thalassomonas sp. M1454 TaxID=2594477 RepID=UPI00117E71C5|nr:hypothetical protein [Thalassomonas sp. M1454]TRX52477.1 hypothetical protein FNN08_16030 [Thalassomonas sp. M1454]
MFDKQKLLVKIIEKLQQELDNAVFAAETARTDATDDQSVAETQYDTLGIEASYLAHGQSERAEKLKQQINQYKKLKVADFNTNDEIAIGCLIKLSGFNQQRLYFIGPSAGGIKFSIDAQEVLIITPQAPIAKELIGKYQFDQITMPGKSLDDEGIEILAVY